MTVVELREAIIFWSKKNNLNPDLVAAIVSTESACNPNAIRYEKNWRYILKPEVYAPPLMITLDTEIVLQKFSYGLMQVMGSVAREYGFTDHLFRLLEPDFALQYGCKHLAIYSKIYGSEKAGVSAYNQGNAARDSKNLGFKNQAYVDKVWGFYDKKLISSL